MKILFPVYQLSSGGAERTVSYLSSYLAKKGHEVYILTYVSGNFYDVDSKVKMISLEQKVFPANSFNMKQPRYLIQWCSNKIKELIRIPMIIAKLRPDVVFCMLAGVAKPFINLKKKYGYKLITSERSNPLLCTKREFEERKKFFEISDGVIFQTRSASKCYSSQIQRKSIVIANAVGNNDVYNKTEIFSRRKVICSIGRLVEEKDLTTLLKAFAIFIIRYPDFCLEIYGKGPEEENLIKLSRELGIEKQVLFMGEDKHALLKCADATCFVMTSKYEGMPNALMEAMAIGLPCISTNCKFGPAELIQSGENGFLVEVGDEKAIADAMCRFVEDNSLARRCSENAQKILKKYTIGNQCALFEKYICEI